jgi:hypothetical protein
MAVTDSDRALLAGQMHDAIIRFVAMCAEDVPGLDASAFDYRIDITQRDGGKYPLIYRTDPSRG